MNNIKVSILVPICNVEKYLGKCLESIVNQTLKDIEIICLNDGSTDNSLQIIKDFANKDSRIVVIDKPNSGYGDSMNKGLNVARGEYIGIVESDDFADLNMFEELYGLAKEYDAELVKSNFRKYWENPEKKIEFNTMGIYDITIGEDGREKMLSSQASIWSAIYKRSWIEENNIRFLPTPGASYQDTSFHFKVGMLATKLVLTPKSYLNYRQDNINLSVKAVSAKKRLLLNKEYKEIYEFIKNNKIDKYLPILCTVMCKNYFDNYNTIELKERDIYFNAICDQIDSFGTDWCPEVFKLPKSMRFGDYESMLHKKKLNFPYLQRLYDLRESSSNEYRRVLLQYFKTERIDHLIEVISNVFDAGPKAREDITLLLSSEYTYPIGKIVNYTAEGLIKKIFIRISPVYWGELFHLLSIKDHTLLLQHPITNYFIGKDKIRTSALHKLVRSNRIIALVHDMESIRRRGRSITQDDEVSFFNNCIAVIAHNERMKSKMIEMGVTSPIVTLEIFDYLLPSSLPEQKYYLGKDIIFAGNLAKSDFLLNTEFKNIGVNFKLYGQGLAEECMSYNNVEYRGALHPDEVPYKLEGSFGLIWDGSAVDSCDGMMGEYTRYNNPHKLSLYIVAGLPVIVWSEAAIADVVRKYNIGICVDSLNQIEHEVNNLSENNYRAMLDNIHELRKKVSSGFFFMRALDEVTSLI